MIVDIVFGFLGSGKTTFIVRALQELGADEKTVILVNEFGEVGIDGDLLAGQGGNVVEMPSGCICCTLQADFRSQILEILQTLRPERMIIEPTGVATISQIRSIVESQLFEDYIEKIHNILVVDATGFMELYKANRHFVESQVENAQLVLLNKCDRVDKRKAMLIRDAISAIHPDISVLMTEFGAADWAEYRLALSAASSETEQQPSGILPVMPEQGHHGENGMFHFHEQKDALGYQSFGCIFDKELFDPAALENFFLELNSGKTGMGKIVRAKGIFQSHNQWILMELASGELSTQPLKQGTQSKVSVIGTDLDPDRIRGGLNRCMTDRANP